MTAEATAPVGDPTADRHLLWLPDRGPSPIPESLIPWAAHACGPLTWTADETPGHWHARVPLEDLDAGALCVPSLVPGAVDVRGYAMTLTWDDGGRLPLAPIFTDPALKALWPAASMATITTAAGALIGGLDCVEAAARTRAPQLHVHAVTDGPAPQAALLVGTRPRHLACDDRSGDADELDVPALSQMSRTAEIARHVCSPVSIAMVLGQMGLSVEPEAFARSVEHPHHGRLFGMWPLNLAWAEKAGAAGLVRVFTRPDEAAALLARGHPLVTSIRFETGRLPGAPLARTGGHLVVLRGMAGDRVLVNDPAAPDDATVARHYDRRAFLDAWLADRGVAYVLWPRAREIAP
ncbi:MAG TPA: C39 family peptidase [Pseudomonadales bacterium]|nr:C39 family peptidase [Pseudomonadales bacterium]